MNTPLRILRIAIVLEWIFIVAGVVAYLKLGYTLPTELRSYLDDQQNAETSLADATSMATNLVLLLVEFVAAVFLWFRRRWARLPYLCTVLLLLLLTLTDSPSVDVPLSGLFDSLSVLTSGFIVALLYCAPIPFHVPSVRPPGAIWKRHLLATSVGILGGAALIIGLFALIYLFLPEDAEIPLGLGLPLWQRSVFSFLYIFCAIHFASYLLPRGHRQHSALISGMVILGTLYIGFFLTEPIAKFLRLLIPLLYDSIPIIGAILASAVVHAVQQRLGRTDQEAPREAVSAETL